MSDQQSPGGDQISASVGGTFQGQMATGKDIRQTSVVGGGLTPEEREELTRLFAELRDQVRAEAPPEMQDSAVERVDELEEAVTAEEPDLTTIQYVRRWFAKNLPSIAGAVAGTIVHPIVGRLVQAAGDKLVEETGLAPDEPAA